MGNRQSATFQVLFPPAPTWTAKSMPDMSGKVVLVTEGNTGIGKEVAKEMLRKGAKVYIGCRRKDSAINAIAELQEATGEEALFLLLDLESMASIASAAREFVSQETQLHVLLNNGVIMLPPIAKTTLDRYDLQFGANVIGHFLLLKILLPTLVATSKVARTPSRVVFTSSSDHYRQADPINYATLKDGDARRSQKPYDLYAQSKFGEVLLANEVGRRYGDEGITALSLDPGNIKSAPQGRIPALYRIFMNKRVLYPVADGAITPLYASTAPEAAELNGKYLIPWARVWDPNPHSLSHAEGEKLWEWLDEQVAGYDID